MRSKVILSTSIIATSFLILTGFRQQENPTGSAIYQQYCTPCHGADGTKGKWGAKNLQKSTLQPADMLRIISEGKKWMPSWKKKLSAEQIAAVGEFVKTLRRTK